MSADARGEPAGNAAIRVVGVRDFAEGLAADDLRLDPDFAPADPLMFVDLASDADPADVAEAARRAAAPGARVAVGVTAGVPSAAMAALVSALDCTLTQAGPDPSLAPGLVRVADVAAAQAGIAAVVRRCPRAAVTLVGLLRHTAAQPVEVGLHAESLAYSMLLAGPEFARWRAEHSARALRPANRPSVVVKRSGDTLFVELDRADRRNAFGRDVRDGLIEALDLVAADATIERVRLSGRGPAFCSGGDLDEFGSAPDPVTAHLVRLDRSAGRRMDRIRDRVTVHVHGACIGAGAEIACFAGRVVAQPDAFFQLPELPMGLIPGAGGTVSLPRRVGRWRTAYLALSATRIDAQTAFEWGLVDACSAG